MFNQNVFSERLIFLRKQAAINQPQLAEVIGLSKSSVNNIESGRRSASIEVICALADYFDVSVDYLVGRTDNPKVNM